MTPNLLTLAVVLAQAQTVPAGRYETLHTPHFRVHYPVDAAEFARDVATRIESLRARVADEVGWVPRRRMDVAIVDPDSQSNGQAIGDGRSPRMRLYATPPSANSGLGHHRDWTESLLVHEDTHLVHLTWPSRDPLRRFLQRLVGIGPIATKSPRWLVEGYATLVEGRLSGAGRPNDDARADWLRMLAQSGRFPSYDELNGWSRHRSGEFPYLVGSAFLEWIERQHPRTLPDLWRRMTARRSRGFVEAFAGLYGERPVEAYGRFVAEVMAEAWPSDAPDRSTRVAAIDGYFGEPALSPDGARLAVPAFPQDGLPRLTVLETTLPDAAEERAAARKRLLADDPDDVPDIEPPWIGRSTDVERFHLGRVARHARFVDDDTILFDAWTPDPTGRSRPDLFLWHLDREEETRVTQGADVTRPDPAPDGTWAVALRTDWGRTQIVEVDLATGELTERTPLSLDRQVDAPRVSPHGDQIVFLENRGAGWGWVWLDRESGERRAHPTSLTGPQVRSLAFDADGILFGEVAWDGVVGVRRLGVPDAAPGPLAPDEDHRTVSGGARAPVLDADGAAWVRATTPDGDALHRLPAELAAGTHASQAILSRAGDDVAVPPAERGVAARRRYGLGHWSWIPLGGFGVGDSGQGQAELAIVGGDVMGRYSARAWFSGTTGGRGVTGASATLGVRGATRAWRLTGYLGRDRRFGVERAGGTLVRSGSWQLGGSVGLSGSLGGVLERVDLGRSGQTRVVGSATIGIDVLESRRRQIAARLDVEGQVGRTGDRVWRWGTARGTLRLGREFPLAIDYTAGHTTGRSVVDQWTHGGAPVSVWPSIATATWIADPAVVALRQRGTHFDRLDVALGPWPVQGFATRTRVGGSFTMGGVTVVGIRGGTAVASDPFAQLVADGRGRVGFGRTVEDPDGGWSWSDGSWVAFASWTWR